MASQIQAINAYRPRLKLGRMAEMDELVEFIARSTGLNESGVRQVLLELRDATISFNTQGRPVRLEGLGIYTPTISLAGEFKVGHRADMALKKALNAPGAFKGEIENGQHIGATAETLVELWNSEHPEDTVS